MCIKEGDNGGKVARTIRFFFPQLFEKVGAIVPEGIKFFSQGMYNISAQI